MSQRFMYIQTWSTNKGLSVSCLAALVALLDADFTALPARTCFFVVSEEDDEDDDDDDDVDDDDSLDEDDDPASDEEGAGFSLELADFLAVDRSLNK